MSKENFASSILHVNMDVYHAKHVYEYNSLQHALTCKNMVKH